MKLKLVAATFILIGLGCNTSGLAGKAKHAGLSSPIKQATVYFKA